MEQQIFCDGIGRIAVIGNTVRLDLVSYSPTESDASGQPRMVLTHRVVMGTDAFLQSAERVLEAARRLTQHTAQHTAQQAAPPAAAPRPPEQPQHQPQPQQAQAPRPPAPPPPPPPEPPKRPFP